MPPDPEFTDLSARFAAQAQTLRRITQRPGKDRLAVTLSRMAADSELCADLYAKCAAETNERAHSGGGTD